MKISMCKRLSPPLASIANQHCVRTQKKLSSSIYKLYQLEHNGRIPQSLQWGENNNEGRTWTSRQFAKIYCWESCWIGNDFEDQNSRSIYTGPLLIVSRKSYMISILPLKCVFMASRSPHSWSIWFSWQTTARSEYCASRISVILALFVDKNCLIYSLYFKEHSVETFQRRWWLQHRQPIFISFWG